MTNNTNEKQNDLKELDQNATQIGIGGHLAPETNKDSYRQRMQRRKEVQHKRLEKRSQEKSLIIVFTGHGKGKTTAALGMALRTLGHGERVAIVQFIKGGWESGEAKALKNFGKALDWHALGGGFTWETHIKRMIDHGFGGIVCSVKDLGAINSIDTNHNLTRVCPGIKGESDAPGGQARTASAVDAKKGGADYIVVGRAITQADDPVQAIQKMK